MDDIEEIDQFSDESRAVLRHSTDALIAGLRDHVATLLELRGGSSEQPRLFAANDTLEGLLRDWDDAVFDHTGTTALPLDDDEDEDFADEDGADDVPVEVLTLVSRVDLGVNEPGELLAAGRAAHRRLWPKETEADAAVAVEDVQQAVYALLHEAGEPWLDLPGTEFLAAARVYVAPEEYAAPEDEDGTPESFSRQVVVPDGTVLFSESWA
jgi:hypothetical protein